MGDQHIECIDCGRVFKWTVAEQRFYRQRGLSPPKRCATCRHRKRSPGGTSPFGRPAVRYGLLVFGLASALGLLVRWILPSATPVCAWLVASSLVAFGTFVYDKVTAKLDAQRVPEGILLLIAAAGGILGALAGMLVARHKTAKLEFRLRLLAIVAFQAIAVAAYLLFIA